MTFNIRDPEVEANVAFKTRTVGGEQVGTHDIAQLPGTVESDIGTSRASLSSIVTALGSYLSTLAGTVTASRVAVDLSTTALTYLANLTGIATNIGTLAGAITSSVMAAATPDTTASGTLASVNDTVSVAVAGRRYAGVGCSSGFNGTIQAEYSYDSGTNWVTGSFLLASSGVVTSTALLIGSALNRAILIPAGATHVRVKVTVASSGSCTATVRATLAGQPYLPQLPMNLGMTSSASAVAVVLASDDTVKTNIATHLPPASPKLGQVTSIGTSSDVQFTTQALVKGMQIKNISTGGQALYVSQAATPTSTNSMVLLPGEWSNDIECTNVTAVFMRASATGAAACYSGR